MSYFLRKIYIEKLEQLGGDYLNKNQELNALKTWLLNYCGKNKVALIPYTTIQRYCPYSIRKQGKAKLEPLMNQLIATDFVECVKINKTKYINLLKT
ncbi:hypothetical protein [Acinetobacter bereziniae]|uniref:hypothetical protein n=1 Tax=Acinetobacter bereziniae TaxID=106648 RepID=UPI00124F9069|nr:hypothetical protein [Acinetobacter bereziniae]